MASISGKEHMKLPRRKFLHLAAGAAALPAVSRIARAQAYPVPLQSGSEEKVLAERLAAYAHDLRYDRSRRRRRSKGSRSHVIDSLGCAIGALDEKTGAHLPRGRLSNGDGGATVIGTDRRVERRSSAAFANDGCGPLSRLQRYLCGPRYRSPERQLSRHVWRWLKPSTPACVELDHRNRLAYESQLPADRRLDVETTRGWDPPVFGLPAVALAAGRLMKLGP